MTAAILSRARVRWIQVSAVGMILAFKVARFCPYKRLGLLDSSLSNTSMSSSLTSACRSHSSPALVGCCVVSSITRFLISRGSPLAIQSVKKVQKILLRSLYRQLSFTYSGREWSGRSGVESCLSCWTWGLKQSWAGAGQEGPLCREAFSVPHGQCWSSFEFSGGA